MSIENQLKNTIQQALSSLFEVEEIEIALQPTKKDFEGNYTFVVFPLVKILKKNPTEIGNAIGNYLKENTTTVSDFNVVQGFLNIVLNNQVWVETLNAIVSEENFGFLPKNGQSVMVEYSSPNTNKPLHLGHLRTNFLGFSVAKILEACGYDVVKTCLVNDRGIHICKSMIAYQTFGKNETPEGSGIKGDHLVGKYYVEFDKKYKEEIAVLVAEGQKEDDAKKNAPSIKIAQEMLLKWENGDKETLDLWRKMNDWVFAGFNQTYKKIGVSFDKLYYESDTYLLGKTVIDEALEKGIFFKKENGSVWVDLKDVGLDEKLVLRADGTSVYITQDLGTTDLKFKDFGNNKSIWVVGNEQDYHFQVLFAIMKKLGRSYADGCFHLSYGMVDLPTGKMKSREGTVVDADDLVDEVIETAKIEATEKGKIDNLSEDEKLKLFEMVGLGAIKYLLLKIEPKKRMLFDPKESVDLHGHTGPFIQYTHARCRSVFKRAIEENIEEKSSISNNDLHQIESDLIFLLSQYPVILKEAGQVYSPAIIAQYAYDLAKMYNQFYTNCPILKETDKEKQQFRLVLTKTVAETLKKAMSLLGIDVPERM